MPNAIKYSTTIPTGSLLKGTVALGVTTANISGPTSTTGWYYGPNPVAGKYQIIETAASGDPDVYCPQSDAELIQFVKTKGATGANTGSAAASLAWIGTQSNLMAANIEYENIVTSGSVLNLDAGFVGSYPTTASNWYDLSGKVNNCTLVNGPIYTTSGSGGIQFDATDDYATIPDNNSLDLTELTISLWFNRGDILALPPSDRHNLFAKANTALPSGDEINYLVSLSGPITGGGRYVWRHPSVGSGVPSVLAPPSQILFANQWYNLVFTHVSTNTPIAYLNGVKQTNWTATNPTNALVTNTWQATICGEANRDDKAAAFNGIMSIVQLYNRALSETEVLNNFNVLSSRFFENIVRTGLTFYLDPGYPNCYPGTGTTINNLSGTNTGTLNNGTAYSSSNGGTFIFDGADDTITFGDNTAFQLSGPGTVSFWCRFVTTAQRCVGPQMLASNGGAWAIAIRSNRSVNFEIYPGGAISDTPFTLSAAELPINTWGMLTCISTETGCDGYWNGVYRGSIPFPFPPSSQYSGTNSFSIVDRGTLGPMMIYNRTLTSAEVLQNFNAQKSRFGL